MTDTSDGPRTYKTVGTKVRGEETFECLHYMGLRLHPDDVFEATINLSKSRVTVDYQGSMYEVPTIIWDTWCSNNEIVEWKAASV